MTKSFPKTLRQLAERLDIDLSPSSLVDLNESKLEELSQHMKNREDFRRSAPYGWDDNRFWNIEDDITSRSQYIAVGNCINFRFWKYQHGKVIPAFGTKGGLEVRGAMYMWRCLRVCLDENRLPILDSSFLASISAADFQDIFRDDNGKMPMSTGMEDRIANLRNFGSSLISDWSGSFYKLVVDCDGSLVRFSQSSKKFRAFDDPCYKLTMVNAILHAGSGIVKFKEDPLPGIDYQLLKQLLRTGVLVPSEHIALQLKNGIFLNDTESFELRRIAMHAFILMGEKSGIGGQILDNKWWMNRQNCTDVAPVCLSPSTADQCPFFGVCEQRVDFGIPRTPTRYY